MEKEIDPQVLAVFNEKRLSGEKSTPVEIITRMGVYDARTQASSSAWLATGDTVIATVWAEFVTVAESGRWFYLESLDTHQRLGGGERSALQVQRAKDRIQLLKFSLDEERPVRAVLQANRVPILTAESDKAAKVSVRVPDDEEWHVALWEPEQRYAVMVRGERGWVPTEADLDAARTKGMLPPNPADLADPNATPDDIQAAAIAYLVKYFSSYGYRAENVSSAHFGYDLEVSDKKGKTLLKLSVKGLGGNTRSFSLTAEERARADEGDPWRLAVVTDANSPAAQHKLYRQSDYESAPGLELQF
ncbi:protein NO VEIN domain-containing protein [Xylophilus sp. GOD-11R]|uniref:protein NO VEIN domain-containing protein n=1 Tax=Xylophilus sp. GOD-11R TaxID=3089814 RepID=UPI00298C40BB|nr:DUF3883 domain-containing protein [Xylophilus sp. GOD-11R]WPB55765.1 DUF3883 domain-containing protein [Xylophilus sp. GOD-11R]